MKDLRNYSLLAHNTFGIEAHCRRFVEFSTIEELKSCLSSLGSEDAPLLLLGGGSNLLLTKDFEGTVLHLAIRGKEILPSTEPDTVCLRCGSGEVWDEVVGWSVENDLHGMENLSLIPGEVGASAVQNIGAYGAEAKDLICKVEAVEIATGKEVVFTNADCAYAYRDSRFKKDWRNRFIITYVTYRLHRTFTPDLAYGNILSALESKGLHHPTAQQLRDTIIEIRQSKLPDPKTLGNAGSFFMNPIVEKEKFEELSALYPNMPHYTIDERHEKIPAGWMIEQCGWKGRAKGRAGVYEKQSLVLVNLGQATGAEIVALCQQVIRDVKQKFGIEIRPEVNII